MAVGKMGVSVIVDTNEISSRVEVKATIGVAVH